ncbi:hypothetical protein [Spirosoma harenae]
MKNLLLTFSQNARNTGTQISLRLETIKYAPVYALLVMVVFCTSCQGQNKPHHPKDTINYTIKDTLTAYGPRRMVRNIKQDRNGNILFAASWGGVFGHDGKSFTNIASK